MRVDRAAAQLRINGDVARDRRRDGERFHERRRRVDRGPEGLVLGGSPQCLDAARGGARSDGHERLRRGA